MNNNFNGNAFRPGRYLSAKLLLFMKLTTFFLVVAFLHVSAKTFSQKVSISGKKLPLEKIFDIVKKQTGYDVLYNPELLKETKPVSISIKDIDLQSALNLCLKDQPVGFYIRYNTVVVTSKLNPTTSSPEIDSEIGKPIPLQVKIQGRVSSEKGELLPGVTIVVKGTHNGTTTNDKGDFTVDANPGDVLVFSIVGYTSQEIIVGNQTSINVVLKMSVNEVEQVVVIGYGTQRKASLTAAISTISSDEIKLIPSSNLSNVLQGRLSGTYVRSTTGTPGIASDIKIRANTSFNNTPVIYVIDGVVRDATSFNALSPNEVAEITVLKDAASAAIYGSRSSGGAILVTTKSGRSGKPVIEFSTVASTSHFANLPQLSDMSYNLKMQRENLGRSLSDEEVSWVMKNNPDGMEYFNSAYSTPNNQNYALSISGGTDMVKYFIGGSYFNEKGALPQVGYKKYNLRGNIQVKLTRDLSVGLNLSNSYGLRSRFSSNWYGNSANLNTYYFMYAADPFFLPYIDGKAVDPQGNPNITELMKNSGYWNNPNQQIDVLPSLEYKIPFVKGLKARVSYSKNIDNNFIKVFGKQSTQYIFKKTGPNSLIPTNEVLSTVKNPEPSQEYVGNEYSKSNAYQFNTQLTYEGRFGKHRIDAIAAYEQYEFSSNYFNGYRYTFPLYATDQYFATSGDSKNWKTTGSEGQDGRLSYIGRINYDYDNKYLLSASLRADGSIKFSPAKRWGYFPSVSAGWVISNENFFKSLNANRIVDLFKLRASLASTGNDAIGGWQWLEQFNLSGSSFYRGGGGGITAPLLTYGGTPNPKLTWEKSNTYNIGFDARFVQNLSLTVEYWLRRTYDILGNRILAIPSEFGASLPAENYGKVNGHGFEIELGYANKLGKNFSYNIRGNFSYATTNVIKWDVAGGTQEVNNPIGKTLSYFTGLKSLGVLRTQADLDKLPAGYTINGAKPELGMLNFADIDGPGKDGKPDGKIDSYDNVILGKYNGAGNAPFSYGLNVDLSFKGFNVGFSLAGLGGFKTVYTDYYGRQLDKTQRFSSFYNDSWSTDNPNGKAPKLYGFGDARQTYQPQSTYNTFDGSFLRLKYINIGYGIPEIITNKVGLSNIRLFLSGTNLLTLSRFKYYDPEIAGFSAYPLMKTYSFGVDVKF
ncbi:TonB-linked SusC/RagA family outer membrane protein [Chitinophaga polysaccharea]|uniref:TonB-linked SusC/RagA family outer membrane protein n=1 Tax=Chitinophaga polysaccharea TaxID=1293035 RepID=A0A561Q5T4_9BACT|nr:TonB-dependent receptor [Chitinophaga polysaccharea]TWF45724.1 TonB-linked SusC/RagA family outer membrane protein [Chitinophaga polysaccharea]